MNSNRRVVLFVAWSAGLYLLISLAGTISGINLIPPRVNLVADILHTAPTSVKDDTSGNDLPSIAIEKKPGLDFTLYHRAKFFTNFSADTAQPSMTSFVGKLHELKTGKK